ncbi:DNA cytosine methyltransferase [bacterium]|nr:DNA cytosine methyltransferase [bacterium]
MNDEGITVLSICDGAAIGREALKSLNIKVKNYFAYEIKKTAILCATENHDDIIHLGDVTKADYKNGMLYHENGSIEVPKVDLIIGGTPCQDFSIAQMMGGLLVENREKRKGLDGIKSVLFYKYLELKNKTNAAYFFLENVKMKKEAEKELNDYMGVNALHINSKLVTFQSRPRLYWTNIPFATIPTDRHINYQYYKDTDFDYCSKFKVNKTPSRIKMWNDGNGRTDMKSCNNVTNSEKIGCLTRKQDRAPNSGLIEFDGFCRYLTTRELELAQGVPIGYTKMLTKNQSEDILGDGWTLPIIVHLMSGLKKIF